MIEDVHAGEVIGEDLPDPDGVLEPGLLELEDVVHGNGEPDAGIPEPVVEEDRNRAPG